MQRTTFWRSLCKLALGCALAWHVIDGGITTAEAYLGSFNQNDGYHLNSGTILGDVSIYNAGASGINAGGGGFASINADTGLWKVVGPVGGYFATAANRNAVVSGGPPYPTNPATAVAAYIVGDHFMGRPTDGVALALRNDTPLGTGAMIYDYSLDTYDFGGPTPASVNSGIVLMQFYFCPNPGDTPVPGTVPREKFTMSLVDSVGNVGMQWGYARDNSVYWRDSSSNPWVPTSIVANQLNYDGMRISLDLNTDTFGVDYYVVNTNTWSTMVPAGTPMGQPMQNFTKLQWQLEDGLFAGLGGKNFFDDFSFTIPEPSTYAMLAMAALGGLIWRRRRG
ncbi:MAG: PEP-CTERM sorting domain-containing protein [Pirellulales bacterium]|nr:PEP-CTERM sorting domain-containing protein [Pirellulales bacterium]